MKCKNCEINEAVKYSKYSSGDFCSKKCARGFATKKNRKLISEKVSKTLKQPDITKQCEQCGTTFDISVAKKNQRFCSVVCSAKYRWTLDDYKIHMTNLFSERAILRHKTGDTSFGWQIRKQFEPSYPESIAIRFFEENNIKFDREEKCGKYFIDFVIWDTNIAIEIDGKQHEKPERILSDKKKDLILRKNGWVVYRIKFPQENIQKILKQIINRVVA